MAKRLDFSLSIEELQILEEAIKNDERLEVVKRAIVLRLLHSGYRPEAAAEILSVTWTTIYLWHHRWKAEGLEGLADRPRSGRRRKADEDYCHLLAAALETDPRSLGYDFTLWTSDRLRAHLEQHTGISLSRGRFNALMKDLGYVYRRPKQEGEETEWKPRTDTTS